MVAQALACGSCLDRHTLKFPPDSADPFSVMSPYREPSCLGNGCHGRRVLGRSEDSDLARLAALASRVLHAPIAYIAISQPDGHPTCRVDAGTENWEILEALPDV